MGHNDGKDELLEGWVPVDDLNKEPLLVEDGKSKCEMEYNANNTGDEEIEELDGNLRPSLIQPDEAAILRNPTQEKEVDEFLAAWQSLSTGAKNMMDEWSLKLDNWKNKRRQTAKDSTYETKGASSSGVEESSTTQQIDGNDPDTKETEEENHFAVARKAGVALAGGTLIAVGIPLIPLPGPGDFMVLGGMALLATEFPAAQRALDESREKLTEFLEKSESQKNTDDDDDNDDVEFDNDSWQDDEYLDEDEQDEIVKEIQHGIKTSTKVLKRHAEHIGRHVILPLLNTVCTRQRNVGATEPISEVSNGEGENPDLPHVSAIQI